MLGASLHTARGKATPPGPTIEYLGWQGETSNIRQTNFIYADYGIQQGDLVISYMTGGDFTYNDMIVPSYAKFSLLDDSRRSSTQRMWTAVHVAEASTGIGDGWYATNVDWAWQTHHFRNWTGYAVRGKTYQPGGNGVYPLPDLTVNYAPQDGQANYYVIHGVGYKSGRATAPTQWDLEGSWDTTHMQRSEPRHQSLLTGVKLVNGSTSMILGQNVSSDFNNIFQPIHGMAIQVW